MSDPTETAPIPYLRIRLYVDGQLVDERAGEGDAFLDACTTYQMEVAAKAEIDGMTWMVEAFDQDTPPDQDPYLVFGTDASCIDNPYSHRFLAMHRLLGGIGA